MPENKYQHFMWAQGENANVRQPIRELREAGWQHRDIPKASNVNWMFKQISDEFAAMRKELATQAALIKEQQAKLGALSTGHNNLKKAAKQGFHKAEHDAEFNIGISRQICRQLEEVLEHIRVHHPELPKYAWPLKEHELS